MILFKVQGKIQLRAAGSSCYERKVKYQLESQYEEILKWPYLINLEILKKRYCIIKNIEDDKENMSSDVRCCSFISSLKRYTLLYKVLKFL